MAILEPCPAGQYRNGRIVIEDAHILGMSQLFNTSLLLGQQLFAQHLWLRWRQAVIKRAGAAQMSDMCSADHDLGRHATRSGERRVGKGCVSTGRSRWSPCHQKKNIYRSYELQD